MSGVPLSVRAPSPQPCAATLHPNSAMKSRFRRSCLKKIKTNELKGIALDWAVAKCEGLGVTERLATWKYKWNKGLLRYSADWGLAGPIIDREHICLEERDKRTYWAAYMKDYVRSPGWHYANQYSPRPLEAAMRCYVNAKLGDEVEIPEELLK